MSFRRLDTLFLICASFCGLGVGVWLGASRDRPAHSAKATDRDSTPRPNLVAEPSNQVRSIGHWETESIENRHFMRKAASSDASPTVNDTSLKSNVVANPHFEKSTDAKGSVPEPTRAYPWRLSAEEIELVESLPKVCTSELPGIELRSERPATVESALVHRVDASPTVTRQQVIVDEHVPPPPPPQIANANESQFNPHANATASGFLPPNPTGEDPHWEVYSRSAYPSATECATCHQQIYDEWANSSHAYAAISPMFHRFEDTINKLAQGTIGYFCLRCHAPVATTMGLRRDQAIWDGPRVFREGVTCVACHRVKIPYVKANGERRLEPGDIYHPVYGSGDGLGVEIVNKYSEYFKTQNSASPGTPAQPMHRRSIQFEQLSDSTFCMSCHQVAVQPGIKLEVVWDQYRASPAYRQGTTCQDCHMGKVPGVAEGYSVGPAAVINNLVVNPERKHSNHMFYGPGYSIAHPGIFPHNKEADRWTVNQWLEFDWRAGWGTSAFEEQVFAANSAVPNTFSPFPPTWSNVDDRYDAREILDENLKKLFYKKDIRRQILENGSKLDGPFFLEPPRCGEALKFYYCLTNLNPGHNMPSGSLGAQPQIWLNAVLIGPDGRCRWETGYLDSNGDLADLHSLDVLAGKVPIDPQLFNLQTKFLTSNVKGTDREMYLPINVDFDQLPFIRPAAQPVSVLNHPPFIRMEGHSLPPLGSRKAKFHVPARLIHEPGTYRLSVRMRSRAEPIYFMRFCCSTPEMERMMNEWMVDFHVYSATFEVR
jgi:hypothetical protein